MPRQSRRLYLCFDDYVVHTTAVLFDYGGRLH